MWALILYRSSCVVVGRPVYGRKLVDLALLWTEGIKRAMGLIGSSICQKEYSIDHNLIDNNQWPRANKLMFGVQVKQ